MFSCFRNLLSLLLKLYLDQQLQVHVLAFGSCPPDLLVAATGLQIDTLQRERKTSLYTGSTCFVARLSLMARHSDGTMHLSWCCEFASPCRGCRFALLDLRKRAQLFAQQLKRRRTDLRFVFRTVWISSPASIWASQWATCL